MKKHWLRVAGLLISISCLAIVINQLLDLRAETLTLAAGKNLLAPLLASTVIYSIALGLFAIGWMRLITKSDSGSATPAQLIGLFARTSIAKYLPGNVFHFAGRQIMAAKHQFSQRDIAMASVTESVCILLGAMMLAAAAFLTHHEPIAWLVANATLLAVVFSLWSYHRIASMLAVTVAFFCVNELLLGWFVVALGHPWPVTAAISFAYLTAWSAGNVVPGAPGGIGVREAAFIALGKATAIADPASIALIAVAMRIVTLGGDLLFFLYGLICLRPAKVRASEDST